MSFWDNVFQGQPQQPVNPPLTPLHAAPKAWWQDDATVQQLVGEARSGANTPPAQGYGLTPQEIQQIRKRGHNEVNAEQAEQIAEYELATKAKYQNRCPECDSGNYLPAGMRMGGVVMPTNKCFNCGGGARSPEPAVGGGSGQGSIHTRQIDTGGAGGNGMFGKLSGVPRSYMPRA